jgi:uncharacterized protein with NAD-binding domain and iron-sulfur cluster
MRKSIAEGSGNENGRPEPQQEGKKIAIAILGGGPAALTAAYYLTTFEPEKYDITVYEMSWRLGGKTASGRGEDHQILEHGLHVFFGGYHNTFDLMLGCYDALRKECPGARTFAHFFDTIVPGDYGVIGDDRSEPNWRQWDLQFPMNTGVPGDPPLPTTFELSLGLIQVAIHMLCGGAILRRVQAVVRKLFGRDELPRTGRRRARDVDHDGGDWFVNRVLIPLCLTLLDGESWAGRLNQALTRFVHRVVRSFTRQVEPLVKRNNLLGRVWTAADLMLATWKGLSHDRVLFRPDGYQRLDHLDLREWLSKHGACELTLRSPLVRIVYDAAFSYPEGGRRSRDERRLDEAMAAGAALRIILWMALSYKGAMYYKMLAGMGDVMHVPLYLLLKQRGVTFKFFHKITALRPGVDAHDRPVIDAIELEELAEVLPGGEYDPLIQVGQRGSHEQYDCWPARPRIDLLTAETRESARCAERFFHSRPGARRLTLRRRNHAEASTADGGFDRVIFAIPVACIPYLCPELMKSGQGNWDRQGKVGTTQTVALQLWSKYSLRELGWRQPAPLLSLFWDPLNTWSDMGQVLPQERRPHGTQPAMVAYFCGPLPHEWQPADENKRLDPDGDRCWREAHDRQAERARDRLFERLAELWPNFSADGPRKERIPQWHILYDPANRAGEERQRAQYVRANFDPHERCTLALPCETDNRIDPESSGFANLTVAGDWTANHILAACCEGTVQSGIRAARAISVHEDRTSLYRIIGEDLLNPGETFGRRGIQAEPPPSARRCLRIAPKVMARTRDSDPGTPGGPPGNRPPITPVR